MSGKALRLGRLVPNGPNGSLLIALDHGLAAGPLAGLEDPVSLMESLGSTACRAYILNKGMLARASRSRMLEGATFILHASVSTRLGPDPDWKLTAGQAREALRLGADGLSVQVTFGHPEENSMLAALAASARDCEDWGLPLLVMAYLHGGNRSASGLAHAARVCAELGADLVKLPFPEMPEDLETVCCGAGIPVLLAGGERQESTGQLEDRLARAMMAGARGAVVGRQIFQSSDPAGTAARLMRLLANPVLSAGKGNRNVQVQGILV